jgi:hypothetical protein
MNLAIDLNTIGQNVDPHAYIMFLKLDLRLMA